MCTITSTTMAIKAMPMPMPIPMRMNTFINTVIPMAMMSNKAMIMVTRIPSTHGNPMNTATNPKS